MLFAVRLHLKIHYFGHVSNFRSAPTCAIVLPRKLSIHLGFLRLRARNYDSRIQGLKIQGFKAWPKGAQKSNVSRIKFSTILRDTIWNYRVLRRAKINIRRVTMHKLIKETSKKSWYIIKVNEWANLKKSIQ